MAGRLDGKVVLVSGGASGIGAAHVRVFAAEGAKVMVADVQEDKGGEVADSVNNDGGVAVFVRSSFHTRKLSFSCFRRSGISGYPCIPLAFKWCKNNLRIGPESRQMVQNKERKYR